MAITRVPPTTPSAEQSLQLIINNGDLAALNETVERLGFKDAEGMLRYALAVLSKSKNRFLTITEMDGQKNTLQPSDQLLRPEIVAKISEALNPGKHA